VADLIAYTGWDSQTLGKLAGIDPSMVGRWVRGETQPGIESIRGVCKAAGLDIREGLVAAGMLTEDELHFEAQTKKIYEPDWRRISDEAFLAENHRRMRRHLHADADVHVTAEQSGVVNGYTIAETIAGDDIRTTPRN